MGKNPALFVEVNGELRIGFPVDGGECLGLVGGGLVEIPRERGGRDRGRNGFALVAGNGKVGEKAGSDLDRLESGAAVVGKAGLGNGVDVTGEIGREAFGAVEVAAVSVNDIAKGPVGGFGALGEDAVVGLANVVPLCADVGLVLGPFLGAAVNDEGGNGAVLGREVVVLEPDAGDAALGMGFNQRVHHEQVAGLAHRQPRHGGDLVVAGDFGEGIELLLEKRDGGGGLVLHFFAVGRLFKVHETRRAPDDAEIIGGAHGADGGVPDEPVLGHIGAQNEESAHAFAVLRNPEVGRCFGRLPVAPRGAGAALHELENLIHRRRRRLGGERQSAHQGEEEIRGAFHGKQG